jgi:arginine decarboxylase
MGVKDLGDKMWAQMKASRMAHWEAQAYARLPDPKMPPRRAFQKLMAGEADLVPLQKMANRVVGVGVIPYPPGIPIVMPGESIGPADGAWITFLKALLEWGLAFPGFAKEVEGTVEKDETYWVYCLK